MPSVKPGEKKKDFISRCIPILIDEGRKQKQAAAICFSMWERKNESTEEIIDKVLNEAEEYTVMFFDPNLADENRKDKARKSTLVIGKVSKERLNIIDGDVWSGADLDDILPEIAEKVKKHKPQTVFVEDNYFQRLLKKFMDDYNIPFKGIARVSSKMAMELAADAPEIEWKIQKNKDLLFGTGSLLILLKKMKKVIGESTAVADVIDKDTPVKDMKMERRRNKKKCKKSKEFKDFLSKDA